MNVHDNIDKNGFRVIMVWNVFEKYIRKSSEETSRIQKRSREKCPYVKRQTVRRWKHFNGRSI